MFLTGSAVKTQENQNRCSCSPESSLLDRTLCQSMVVDNGAIKKEGLNPWADSDNSVTGEYLINNQFHSGLYDHPSMGGGLEQYF